MEDCINGAEVSQERKEACIRREARKNVAIMEDCQSPVLSVVSVQSKICKREN
jgi:hypothetical protein